MQTLNKNKSSFKVSTPRVTSLLLHTKSDWEEEGGGGGFQKTNPVDSIPPPEKTNASGDGQKQATPVVCADRY